jgi:N-acetylmuramoyl-L-alanine amidase
MRWSRSWILAGVTLFTCTLFIQAKNYPFHRKQDKPIRTIVIDAGHGDQIRGARGKHSTEEGVTLDVALKLGKLIEANMKDVRVVYTRKGGNNLEPTLKADLKARAELANREKGDLFISIHCNSAPPLRVRSGSRTYYVGKGKKRRKRTVPTYTSAPNPAKGTETYIWATSKNSAKLETLREKSSVVVLDDGASEESKQLMADDPETFILLNTLRNAYFDQSLRLSSTIEDEFTKVGRVSRGARQRNEKGIWVLQATAMPSVLIELGFLTNPEEEAYLTSANGQEESARCIFNAIKRYKENLERFGNYRETQQQQATPAPATPPPAEPTVQPISTGYRQPETPAAADVADADHIYKIQLLVSDKSYKPGSSIFRKLKGPVAKEPVILNNKRLHKYIWGNFKTEPEANTALHKAKQLGFRDAFVVPYRNGIRQDVQL